MTNHDDECGCFGAICWGYGRRGEGGCDEFGKCFDDVKRGYDWYFGGDLHIYNPKSVVDGMQSLGLKSFWSGTETYEALQVYIDLNMD